MLSGTVHKVLLANVDMPAFLETLPIGCLWCRMERLEQSVREREQLAEGLHLIDFEQLKIENQSLTEKIEERNEELLKLRRKITTTVQVPTACPSPSILSTSCGRHSAATCLSSCLVRSALSETLVQYRLPDMDAGSVASVCTFRLQPSNIAAFVEQV